VKRFYKQVSVATDNSILLDGKPIKTPAKGELVTPTRALAEAIAQEWREQGAEIKPATMLLTKLANTAIDRAEPLRQEILRELSEYAQSDLLCYRAAEPIELRRRQQLGWDPLFDWASKTFGARLTTTHGVGHIDQDGATVAALERHLRAQDRWRLTALHSATMLTGSLILALALAQGRVSAAQAFELSTIDEAFQAENWGPDHEAQRRAQQHAAELAAAALFLSLLSDSPSLPMGERKSSGA
jgi:chaperone required for assembly of F1-ATPase